MTATQADTVMIAAFLAASFYNRQGLIIVAGYLSTELAFAYIDNPIYYNCLSGLILAASGAVFIKLLSSIRNALLLSGCLYWLAAVDAYLFPITETIYYNSFAYLVGMVDLYILYLLIGGRRLVRINRATSGNSNFRLADLQLLQVRIEQDKR